MRCKYFEGSGRKLLKLAAGVHWSVATVRPLAVEGGRSGVKYARKDGWEKHYAVTGVMVCPRTLQVLRWGVEYWSAGDVEVSEGAHFNVRITSGDKRVGRLYPRHQAKLTPGLVFDFDASINIDVEESGQDQTSAFAIVAKAFLGDCCAELSDQTVIAMRLAFIHTLPKGVWDGVKFNFFGAKDEDDYDY